MPLSIGSRLGHYDVTALIGEGGMGQVYQATDTKLNRQVALKILPEAFAADPDRLARFQREAQVLASLNHPNIAQIHGIEEQDDTRALVLELVEGPTLAERISQGPIPVDEALPIVKQIAEESGQSPTDALFDLVIEDELRTVLWPGNRDDSEESWSLRAQAWEDEHTLIGGSDAGAHLDRMCGSPYPSQFLGDCLRGRRRAHPRH